MPREEAFLLDLLLAARKILRYADGVSWEAFRENEILQDAVLRQLSIIGEAARAISESTRLAHPEIPWSGIVSMRNRIIHHYFRVNLETVWEVIHRDLPELITLITPLAPPEDAV